MKKCLKCWKNIILLIVKDNLGIFEGYFVSFFFNVNFILLVSVMIFVVEFVNILKLGNCLSLGIRILLLMWICFVFLKMLYIILCVVDVMNFI